MNLEKARALVAAAISNGLEYSRYSRLDSPEERFNTLFAEVDRHLGEGLNVVAWWQAVRLYRPSSFGNEIAAAVTTFAAADLPGLVSALDSLEQSRLRYELTHFALFQASPERHAQWIELAQTPPLVGLGVACALRALLEAHATDADVEERIEDWAGALRSRQHQVRSSIWWQLAALAPMTGPMRDWSAMSAALWTTASREIEVGEHRLQVHERLVEKLRLQCPMLKGLFARLAERGSAVLQAEAATIIRKDFLRRLRADEWSLPSLENAPEGVEYLPAVGWAIAHEVQTGSEHAQWWEVEFSEHLVLVPRWRTPRGWRRRCGLLLLSACCAAPHLLKSGASEGQLFCDRLLKLADAELPGLMGSGVGAFHPFRFLPSALVHVECCRSPLSDGLRVLKLAGVVQDAAGLRGLIKVVEEILPNDQGMPPWLADLRRLRASREQYEQELYPERRSEDG